MTKHAYVVYKISAYERRQKGKPFMVDDIDGQTLLTLFSNFATPIGVSGIRDDEHERFLRVDSIAQKGCYIRLKASAGKFGAENQIVDIVTGQVAHTTSITEAQLYTMRNLLVVPPASDTAFLVAEKFTGNGVASFIWTEFRRQMRDVLPTVSVAREGLANQEEWKKFLADAKLEQITVVRYQASRTSSKECKAFSRTSLNTRASRLVTCPSGEA